MATERKLDIFYVLGQLDRGDQQLWTKLDEDQRKEFAPLVVMRWMSGTNDKDQIIALNEFVNTKVFQLGEHKELLAKLLAATNNKRQKRYQWLSMKQKTVKFEFITRLLMEHYGISRREARPYIPFMAGCSDEFLLELAEERGWQKEELAALKKELKSRG